MAESKLDKQELLFDEIEQKKDIYEGTGYRFYPRSCMSMPECADEPIALTITSPPYWNAIDYDIHANNGAEAWHREREYDSFGKTFGDYLTNIASVFSEVLRTTMVGGFCTVVVGTILMNKKHYPVPMMITNRLLEVGWEFHQDIIWN